jgi:5-methylcytosine-specific restriction protein A
MPITANKGEVKKRQSLTDLIPLCANCHRMVHRKRNVILTLEDLQKIIKINTQI